MAGTVTCTPLPDQGGFRIFIDWNGDAHPDAPLKVERIVAGQPDVLVRGAYAQMVPGASGGTVLDNHLSNCGELYLWDFEAPMGVPVQYRVRDDPFGDTVTSAPCVLSSDGIPWIKDPLAPCHNIKLAPCRTDCPPTDAVMWIGHEQETYSATSSQFSVIGKRRPIDIFDVRKDAVTVLHFATVTCSARDKILALTAPGSPVYIPAFPEICWPERYLALGDHAVIPLSRDLRRQERLHTLPAVVVDAPVGSICCTLNTGWCDLCNCGADTWDEFDALGFDGHDVLQGLAATC